MIKLCLISNSEYNKNIRRHPLGGHSIKRNKAFIPTKYTVCFSWNEMSYQSKTYHYIFDVRNGIRPFILKGDSNSFSGVKPILDLANKMIEAYRKETRKYLSEKALNYSYEPSNLHIEETKTAGGDSIFTTFRNVTINSIPHRLTAAKICIEYNSTIPMMPWMNREGKVAYIISYHIVYNFMDMFKPVTRDIYIELMKSYDISHYHRAGVECLRYVLNYLLKMEYKYIYLLPCFSYSPKTVHMTEREGAIGLLKYYEDLNMEYLEGDSFYGKIEDILQKVNERLQ